VVNANAIDIPRVHLNIGGLLVLMADETVLLQLRLVIRRHLIRREDTMYPQIVALIHLCEAIVPQFMVVPSPRNLLLIDLVLG
jgi:hypothetical protein